MSKTNLSELADLIYPKSKGLKKIKKSEILFLAYD